MKRNERTSSTWLLIIQRKPLVEPLDQCSPPIDENNELISIFVTSIVTAQKKTWKSDNGSALPIRHFFSAFLLHHSLLDIRYFSVQRSSFTPTGFHNEAQGQRRSRATLGT